MHKKNSSSVCSMPAWLLPLLPLLAVLGGASRCFAARGSAGDRFAASSMQLAGEWSTRLRTGDVVTTESHHG